MAHFYLRPELHLQLLNRTIENRWDNKMPANAEESEQVKFDQAELDQQKFGKR
jgi:hypothetical protein